MKEHSKNLKRRSLLLASCRKWTVGLCALRQHYFPKKDLPLLRREKQSSLTSLSRQQVKLGRRRPLLFPSSWVPCVSLHVNSQPRRSLQNCTCPWKIFRKSFLNCRFKRRFSRSKELCRKSCPSELLANCSVFRADSEIYQGKRFHTEPCISDLPIKGESLALNGGENQDDESSETIVLNNSTKRYCCHGQKQNGTCGLLIIRRLKFIQCSLKSRSLFMMYKKLSMVKFPIRIAKSLPKLRRGKTYKLNKSKPSWVEKITRDWQEDFQWGTFAGGRGTLFPSQKSQSNSPWDLLCLSDMNNNMPGPLIEESQASQPDACLTQDMLFHCRELHYQDLEPHDQNGVAENSLPQLHKGASAEAEAVLKVEAEETPSADSCPEDVFISVTEREISDSGHDGEESNQVMGADEVVLESSKADLGRSDGCRNGPLLVELVQNDDSRSQMEVEGPVNMDVFGVELLDHPYCKSPLDEPLRGSTGQKSGTQKSGKRSSQKVSCVNDEQLAAWLCGICIFIFVCVLLKILLRLSVQAYEFCLSTFSNIALPCPQLLCLWFIMGAVYRAVYLGYLS